MQDSMVTNILGTKYKVIFTTASEDSRLKDNNGCCDPSTKEILIEKDIPQDEHTLRNLDECRQKTIRHEIIHAFLYESGLHSECYWATNEEIVDWFALQLPKITRACTFDFIDFSKGNDMK